MGYSVKNKDGDGRCSMYIVYRGSKKHSETSLYVTIVKNETDRISETFEANTRLLLGVNIGGKQIPK